MSTLWFVVPAHGRAGLTEVCLRQLARTCERLQEHRIRASAVVIADDENLETARALDLGWVEQENTPLGRKLNDGYEFACRLGEADFCVPIGSDDWVDADFIAAALPEDNQVRCSRLSSVVSEDGKRLARLKIPYAIGDGVRIIPRAVLMRCGFRPVPEHVARAIDTRTMERLEREGARLVYHDVDALQIVDWKSREQLNSYERCLVFRDGRELDPWDALLGRYPDEALDEMRSLQRMAVAA